MLSGMSMSFGLTFALQLRRVHRQVHAVGCKRMLDGVLERYNHLGEIWRQLHATPDSRPERDCRRRDCGLGDRDVVEVVVKVWSTTTMTRIAGLSNSRTTVLPSARAPDV